MALININTLPTVSSVADDLTVNIYRSNVPFAATVADVADYVDGDTSLIHDTDTLLVSGGSNGRGRYIAAAIFKTYVAEGGGIKGKDLLMVIDGGVLKKATALSVKTFINPVPTLNRTQSGLIYKDSFNSLAGWTGDTSVFTVDDTDPVMVPFAPLRNFSFGPTVDGTDDIGCRQGTPFVEGGTWYNYYDGWNSATPDTGSPNRALSSNRGRTWTRSFGVDPGMAKGSEAGDWQGIAMGFIAKFGSTYYWYRVIITTTPNGPPYYGDIWSSDSLTGTWDYQYTLPLGSGTFTAVENLPGSIVKVGSTYHLFVQGLGSSGDYTIGRMSSSSPTGPFTLDSTPIIDKTSLDDNIPENPKVFFSSVINKWVMLINTFVAGARSERTYALFSDSITDWSGAVIKLIQREGALDGYPAIGVATHFTGPEAAVIEGANGFVPVFFDAEGTTSIAGSDYAFGRKIRGVCLEPSVNALKFTGPVVTAGKRLFKSTSHSNFVAEFGIEFPDTSLDKNYGIWYRCDGTADNGYLLIVRSGQSLILYKAVDGEFTQLDGANDEPVNALGGMVHRIKVVVNGTSHKAYFDGEAHIDTTDSAFASGTHIGINGFDCTDAKMRLLSFRTASTVTINNLTPGTTVVIRADGKLPAVEGTANGSGVATLTWDHFPLETIEIDGADFSPVGGIWGGDVFTYN